MRLEGIRESGRTGGESYKLYENVCVRASVWCLREIFNSKSFIKFHYVSRMVKGKGDGNALFGFGSILLEFLGSLRESRWDSAMGYSTSKVHVIRSSSPFLFLLTFPSSPWSSSSDPAIAAYTEVFSALPAPAIFPAYMDALKRYVM